MNFKTTLALLIAVIVIGVFIFVTSTDSSKPDQSPDSVSKAPEKPVLVMDGNEVTAVSITPREGSPIKLVKTGTTWRLAEPVNALAQAYAVQDLLSAIQGMKSSSQVPVEGSQAVDTGLKTPDFVVDLTPGSGKPIHLEVGRKVIVGNHTYVRVDKASQAQVVSAEVYDTLGKDASKYRDMTLVQGNSTQVDHVILDQRGEARIELKKENGKWEILLPTKMPADEMRVMSLVGSLTYQRATAYPDAKTVEIAQKLGLLEPRLTAWYSTSEDEPKSPVMQPTTEPSKASATQPATMAASTQPTYPPDGTKLVIGSYDGPQKQNVFATGSSWEGVATVTAGTLSALTVKPLDLRDRTLADIDPEQVQSVRITRTVQTTTQPSTLPADISLPGTVVAIERYHEPAPGPMGPMMPSTNPTTGPTTGSATTQASTEPVESPTWVFAGRDAASPEKVSPSKMDRLLKSLHPMQVQRFLTDPPAVDVGAEIYKVQVTYGPKAEPKHLEYELIMNGSSFFGRQGDLWFDINSAMFEDAAGDFVRTATSEVPPQPAQPAGMPDFSEFNK